MAEDKLSYIYTPKMKNSIRMEDFTAKDSRGGFFL